MSRLLAKEAVDNLEEKLSGKENVSSNEEKKLSGEQTKTLSRFRRSRCGGCTPFSSRYAAIPFTVFYGFFVYYYVAFVLLDGPVELRDGIHQIVSRFLERFCYMCPLLFSCVFPS
jgi:hypothetical protein